MTINSNIATLTASALVSLFNEGVDAYAPAGFVEVANFKNKAAAMEKLEALCAAGNLSIEFDGEKAIFVDMMQGVTGDDVTGDDVTVEGETVEGETVEGDDATDVAPIVTHGDGKGAIARSGFVYGSVEWLRANPRGTTAREEYRKARKLAARGTRKASKAANVEAKAETVYMG